jgi:hypothetical protein
MPKRKLTQDFAMGLVFVAAKRAICIREMYTEGRSYVVLEDDLSALYGSGATEAAAWINAAETVAGGGGTL